MAGFLDLSALLQRKGTVKSEVDSSSNPQAQWNDGAALSNEVDKSPGSTVDQERHMDKASLADHYNNGGSERTFSKPSRHLEAPQGLPDTRTVQDRELGAEQSPVVDQLEGIIPQGASAEVFKGVSPLSGDQNGVHESADVSTKLPEEQLWSPRHVEDKGVIVEERHEIGEAPAEVSAASGSPAHQSSGRFAKVGGLLKKTLSLTRGKEKLPSQQIENGIDEDVLLPTESKESPGRRITPPSPQSSSRVRSLLRKITPGAHDEERSAGEELDAGESAAAIPIQEEAPSPQSSSRVRSLLRKITPGAHDEERSAGEELDAGESAAALPPQVEARSPETNGGVSIEREKSPGITRQSSGRFGSLKRMLSGSHSVPDGTTLQRSPEELMSLFCIPDNLLPGKGAAGQNMSEVGGTFPRSPIVAFLDSNADEDEVPDLRKELTSILGASQVIDVAHLPAADFLDTLLSSIHERASKGDRTALAVKDGLRILVVGEDALFKAVRSALHESRYGHIPVGCLSASSSSTVAQALGLTYGGKVVSSEATLQILWQVAQAGAQSMDCWAVKLSTHRKRVPGTLPSSFENISPPQDGILSYRSLFWNSLRVDMGYANGYKEGGESAAARKPSGWFCCAQPPKVIGSQNVGRLEIRKDGSWCYLELSPKIQTVEFVNLTEAPPRGRRKMKMLEKGRLDAYSDDGLIEIVGIQEGSDVEICLAQTNAVRLELFGNADIDHARLTLDSETWTQSLAGEMTAHPATIEISHGGQAHVLVTSSTSLLCAAPPTFPPPLLPETPPPQEKIRKRSPSPFRRAGGFLRSPSPFRRGPRKRSQSPDLRRGDVPERQVAPSEPIKVASKPLPEAPAQPAPPEEEREGRQSTSAPRKRTPASWYADVATAGATGTGLAMRRPNASVPRTLKVDTDRVQKVGRSPSAAARHAEIVEPPPKILVRTGSSGDVAGRAPSPSLYRSTSRENLDQAISARPPSPALYRSSSRENLERHSSPSLTRQSSGNTGYSPRMTMMHLPRSESPVHSHSHTMGSHSREPTPERMPKMADWAAGTSRKTFNSHTYAFGGAHSHLLTKQEREQAVAIGLGGTLTRDERERMQSLAFGGAYGGAYDRSSTPYRIRSARARYVNPATVSYQASGPLELDLAMATPNDGGKSPPPPVRTARDYFSGPLTPRGLPAVRRSHA